MQFNNPHENTQTKIRDWETLLKEREQWRAQGKTVVRTNGCFDLIHGGRVEFLPLVSSLSTTEIIRKIRALPAPPSPTESAE
ncbi:MAG TPA: hypothetical protein VFD70_17195 [Anaerolineae bacterium]|nr:hypothetical protein [Anaerolineae bacterium]